MRTPQGRALEQLTQLVSGLAVDDDLQGEEWLRGMVFAFVATPHVWPLDDQLYEMLLAWGGFDLSDGPSLLEAGEFTAFLLGTGAFTLVCSHTDETASPLCALITAGNPTGNARGAAAAAEGFLFQPLAMRRVLARQLDDPDQPGQRAA